MGTESLGASLSLGLDGSEALELDLFPSMAWDTCSGTAAPPWPEGLEGAASGSSGAEGKGSARSGANASSKLTAEERLARQRERNRQAQVRYRARRKQVDSGLALRHALMAQTLAAARAEAASRAARNRELERLLQVRDAHVAVLRRGAACAPVAAPPCSHVEPGVSPGQLAILHSLFSAVGLDVIAERWAGLRRSVAALVAELDRAREAQPAGVPALERHLHHTMAGARVLKWRVAHYMRGSYSVVRQVEREATPRDWEDLVRAIGLSRAQGVEALFVSLRTRRRVAAVLRERAALIAAVGHNGGVFEQQAGSCGETPSSSCGGSHAAGVDVAVGHADANACATDISVLDHPDAAGILPTRARMVSALRLGGAVAALEENLKQERAEYFEALLRWKELTTMQQQARVVLLSWPLGAPDITGILAAAESVVGPCLSREEREEGGAAGGPSHAQRRDTSWRRWMWARAGPPEDWPWVREAYAMTAEDLPAYLRAA
ncbi:hypothetical protein QBZ16_001349 [Prototheca wickerhamii]|uniref:BZIP domain-containing protein n=1 Tax=Prototheca wickerhamii TaxID=3111 RepID=A0AAD9IDM0_PROWI|nr:hypothetical protein QBZ16_001349 [Prototheca wickerhamii]